MNQRILDYAKRQLTKARKQAKHDRKFGYEISAPGPWYWEGYADAFAKLIRKVKEL